MHTLQPAGLQPCPLPVSVAAVLARHKRVAAIMPSVMAEQDEDPPVPDRWQQDLAELRGELDQIDDALHDLLIQRAEVVQRVGSVKPDRSLAFRPGRQAAILRRLLSRHHGALPSQAIVGIWSELLAATTAMQTAFTIAVCETDPACAFTQLAREQFGALTALHVYRSPAQTIADVSRGRASVAVLPLPSDTETPGQAWWTGLMQRDEPRIHVVARIPFWNARPDGAPLAQALVAAAVAPDPSGEDRSLVGIELDLETSRARLVSSLANAGFGPGGIIIRRDPGSSVAHALAEVPGFVDDTDPRLAEIAAILRRPVVLGAYAVPYGHAT